MTSCCSVVIRILDSEGGRQNARSVGHLLVSGFDHPRGLHTIFELAVSVATVQHVVVFKAASEADPIITPVIAETEQDDGSGHAPSSYMPSVKAKPATNVPHRSLLSDGYKGESLPLPMSFYYAAS